MRPSTSIAALFVAACALQPIAAQQQHVGKKLPAAELQEFTGTPAKSLKDLAGRAILLEFFAYW